MELFSPDFYLLAAGFVILGTVMRALAKAARRQENAAAETTPKT